LQISAGDLSNDPKVLERQLSLIFELTDHWKALLLLDEADVFLHKRDIDHTHNSLVSVFLRKLEYYQGIMLLTTNRVTDFDDAIQSRIHLALRYNPLGADTRKGIWCSFLKNAVTAKGSADYTVKELDDLAKHVLNGRQVGFLFYESNLIEVHILMNPVSDQECCTGSACFSSSGRGPGVLFSFRNCY
jgi:hypothetical protein